MNQPNYKRRVFIIVTVIILLSIIAVLLLRKESTITLNASKIALPDTVYQHYDENNIFFSNGRSFVKYNILSGESSKLGKDFTLPNITNIHLSKSRQFILFRTERHARNDSLGTILQKEGYSLSAPFWWVMNIETGRLSHLRDTVLDADFDNKDLLYVTDTSSASEGGGGNIIQLLNPADLKTISTQYEDSCFSLSLVGENVYCANATNTVNLLTGSGKKTFDNIAKLYGSLGGEVAVGKIIAKNELTEFFTLNVKTGEKNKLSVSGSESAPPLWSYSGKTVLVPAKNNFLKSADPYSNKSSNLVVKVGGNTDSFIEPVIFFDDDSLLYRDGRSIFIASRRKVNDQKTPDKNYLIRMSGGLTVSYDEDTRSFYASKINGVNQADITKVYEQITKDGYDPLLYRIEFKEVTQEKLSS